MRELTLDEAKKIQVEILDVVTAFCDERGINYFLYGGTLLGAVRHKGFIPWDDDIDLGMLRPDYDRFIAEFNGYNPRYELRCIENDPDYPRPFGRVFDNNTLIVYDTAPGFEGAGMNIDIFVFDNAPDDDKTAKRMYRLRDFLCMMNFARLRNIFDSADGNILRRICVRVLRTILKVLPRSYFSRKVVESAKRYMSQDTKRVGDFTSTNYPLIAREAMKSFVYMEFEGKSYKVPAGWDELLTQIYGDYMTPPPPEKRIGHTPFTLYMKQ